MFKVTLKYKSYGDWKWKKDVILPIPPVVGDTIILETGRTQIIAQVTSDLGNNTVLVVLRDED